MAVAKGRRLAAKDWQGYGAHKKRGQPFLTNPLNLLVGMTRFELATPCSRSRCATRLRYIPNELFLYIFFEGLVNCKDPAGGYGSMSEVIKKQIRELLKAHNAVLLAHNYMRDEVQEIADITGDSLALSMEAAK